MDAITSWLPFNDAKSFVKFAIGVAIVMFALKVSGAKKYVS